MKLANDTATSSILLYVEAITNSRKFMSAARAADAQAVSELETGVLTLMRKPAPAAAQRLAALCGSVVAAGTVTALLAGRTAVSRDAVMAVKEDW